MRYAFLNFGCLFLFRKEGLRLRGQISLGEDIFETKPEPEIKEVEILPTFRELGEVYVADCELRNIRKAPDIKRTMNVDVPDKILNIPAGEVTPHTIVAILKPIINRGSVGQAKKVRTYLHAMFNFGMRIEFDLMSGDNRSFGISSNPVTPVPSPIRGTTTCDRWLDEKELKEVWFDLPNHCNFNSYMALRLAITCGQRIEECLKLRWDGLDGDVWSMGKTKNGKLHQIVLPQIAMDLLEEIREVNGHCEVAFPQTNATKLVMKSVTLSQAVRKMCKNTGMKHWTPRDIRRTYKTLNLKYGQQKSFLDLYQNHAMSDISTVAYVRYEYIKEKRLVAEAWQKTLTGILS